MAMAGRYDEKIVLLGGGSGVYRVARFLKNKRPNLTLIHTVFDNGGDSRRLMDEYDVFAVGDIRRGVRALADPLNPLIMAGYLDHEIDGKKPGNEMLVYLMKILKDPIAAIDTFSKAFGVRGSVRPISLDVATLCAYMSDNTHIEGEHEIGSRPLTETRTISSVYLNPTADIYVGSYDKIKEADKIVICPGSPITSIVANTAVKGFREAINETKAKILYVMNIMTNHSESAGYTASQFAKLLVGKFDRDKFDAVICNTRPIEEHILPFYHRQGADMVRIDKAELSKYTDRIIEAELSEIGTRKKTVRHSSEIASIIANF